MFARILGLATLLTPVPGSAQLVEQWVHRYDDPLHSYDEPKAIACDADGNIIVAGTTTGIGTARDLYVAKYAALDGALIWEKSRSSPGAWNDSLGGMAIDAAGNVAVTGILSLSYTDSDIYIARYAAADGALLWEKQLDGSARSDLGSAIAIDASGNVIITGAKVGIETGDDWYTAKYAAADGALIWERLEIGPSAFDTPLHVAIDSNGNVLATGAIYEPGVAPGRTDIYTVKYAAADGALLWAVRYGSSTKDEHAFAIAIDSADNVIIAGSTGADGYTNNGDLYVAKYAASTGALLWEKIYNGSANGTDVANAVATDSAGNVIVTGESAGIGTGSDFYTAKYAADTGALIWEQRHFGLYWYRASGGGVAVDADGNVIVAGNSFDTGFGMYLARYAGTDGDLLWEFQYSVPPLEFHIDGNYPVVLTPDGGIAVTGLADSNNATWFDFLTLKLAPYADVDNDGLPDPWELAHWGNISAHSAQDDSDCDGLPEILEYAFSLDPRVADYAFQPRPWIENGYLTLTLDRRPGLTYTAESTDNPGVWSSANTTVLINTPSTFKVRDNSPTSAGGSRFLRVKITAP